MLLEIRIVISLEQQVMTGRRGWGMHNVLLLNQGAGQIRVVVSKHVLRSFDTPPIRRWSPVPSLECVSHLQYAECTGTDTT